MRCVPKSAGSAEAVSGVASEAFSAEGDVLVRGVEVAEAAFERVAGVDRGGARGGEREVDGGDGCVHRVLGRQPDP